MERAADDCLDGEPDYPPTVKAPPKPLSLPMYFLRFVQKPLSVMPAMVYREPIVKYGNRLAWVTDLGLVKHILLDDRENFPKTHLEQRTLAPLLGQGILTGSGPVWRWQRQTAAPLFRHADILRYAPAMLAAANEQIDKWRAAAPGTIHPISADTTLATFRVISETMLHSDDPEITETLERSNRNYLMPVSWPLAYGVLGMPEWLPYPGRTARRRAEIDMREAIARMVRIRRANPEERDDLLTRLVAAKNPDTGEGMSDEQIIDNMLTLLVGGHETTAKALAWALYMVARLPTWEQRLLEEIESVAGGGPIEPEHIEALNEGTRFFKEAMRLYPPVSSIVRIAAKDTELGGAPIRAGTIIVVAIYAIHRHRSLWNDPDRFDPERFLPENESRQARYQFMPFGAGPRVCLGASFAMVEAIAMFASFIRAARFDIPNGYVPVPLSRVTLRAKGGMPLKVWPRAAAAA